MNDPQRSALPSLLFHGVFAAYHLALGHAADSRWFLALGVYYLLLSAARFFTLLLKGNPILAARVAGGLLLALALPLAGTVVLSVIRDRGYRLPPVIMIGMAAYAFTKITIATVYLVRSRRCASLTSVTLRNLSFADAAVSLFALQRSMLVSFEGMTPQDIRIMNASTGAAVCAAVLLLGFHLARPRRGSPPPAEE